MKQNQKKQHGYTIVEILIGVIVAAIVVAGIYAGWNSFYKSNQSATMNTDMIQIIQNTQTLYQSASNYSDLTNSIAFAGGVFPTDLKTSTTSSTTTVKNAFGGTVTLVPTSGDNTTFNLTYTNVPSTICEKVLSSLNTSNLTAFYTNKNTSLWKTGQTSPTVGTIMTACSDASGFVSVTLTAR